MENKITISKSYKEDREADFRNQIQNLMDAPKPGSPTTLVDIYSEHTVGILRKKKVKKFEGQYVQRKGNYFTFRGVTELINTYFNLVIDKKETLSKSVAKNYFGFPEYYPLEFKYDKCKEILEIFLRPCYMLVVSCRNIPKIISGDLEKFKSVKEELYNFILVLKLHKKFVEIISKNIQISDNIFLGIEVSNILNYIRSNNEVKFSTFLKFGQDSLLECQYKKNKPYLLTYSEDVKFYSYLCENKQKLYSDIFIKEDKIVDILSIINSLRK